MSERLHELDGKLEIESDSAERQRDQRFPSIQRLSRVGVAQNSVHPRRLSHALNHFVEKARLAAASNCRS